jgi:hypothetical protein
VEVLVGMTVAAVVDVGLGDTKGVKRPERVGETAAVGDAFWLALHEASKSAVHTAIKNSGFILFRTCERKKMFFRNILAIIPFFYFANCCTASGGLVARQGLC